MTSQRRLPARESVVQMGAALVAVFIALSIVGCGRSAPSAERLPQGVYDDEELDHFFRDAERILGDRISWTQIGDVEDLKQVVRVGAVDMSDRDRAKLEQMAPQWVEVDAFETHYSERELKRFGRDAMATLERAGLSEYFTGLEFDIDTVWVSVNEDRPEIREALDEALPADIYRIDVNQGGET